MFVPAGKPTPREANLVFDDGNCYLHVNGVRILGLEGDSVVLTPYVSEQVTGMRVGLDCKVIVKCS